MAAFLPRRGGVHWRCTKLGQMKLHPRVTRTGVELVKRFEGLRRRAARLPDGGWTIGYGHTVSAREGAEVTPEDAEALLYYDLSEVAGKLDAWTFTPLNQNQFEALSAFAFNISTENFRNSTVLKRVNEGQHLLAGAAMELWRKADFNGEDLVVDALVRRRAAEKAHYLTPPEGFRPAPSPVLRPAFDHSVIEAAAQAQAARHATVVDVPLEGDTAVALLQAPEALEPKTLDAFSPSHEPVAEAPPSLAETLVSPPFELLAAQEPTLPGSEPAQQLDAEPTRAAPEPVNDRDSLAAPTFAGPAATAVGFRGFESPPRRFEQTHATQPANETNASHEPATADPVEALPASGFSLFDRPLPPPPTALPLQASRSMRLAADADVAPTGFTSAVAGASETLRTRFAAKPSKNRVFLYGSIGVLGVFLFSVAVGNMAFGKASSATLGTLFIGVLGIALMTWAGMWFWMHHLNSAPAVVTAPQD